MAFNFKEGGDIVYAMRVEGADKTLLQIKAVNDAILSHSKGAETAARADNDIARITEKLNAGYAARIRAMTDVMSGLVNIRSLTGNAVDVEEKHAKALSKSAQAGGMKINALDMLVGRFVLYTQAVMYAQMAIEAYDQAHQKMIDAAVKGEELLDEKYRILTKAIKEQKDAQDDLNNARGDLLKSDHIKVLEAEAVQQKIIAEALNDQADAYQVILRFKDKFAIAVNTAMKGPGNDFESGAVMRGQAYLTEKFRGRTPTSDEVSAATLEWGRAQPEYNNKNNPSRNISGDLLSYIGGQYALSNTAGGPPPITGMADIRKQDDTNLLPFAASLGLPQKAGLNDKALDALLRLRSMEQEQAAIVGNSPAQRRAQAMADREKAIYGGISAAIGAAGPEGANLILDQLNPTERMIWDSYDPATAKKPGTWDVAPDWKSRIDMAQLNPPDLASRAMESELSGFLGTSESGGMWDFHTDLSGPRPRRSRGDAPFDMSPSTSTGMAYDPFQRGFGRYLPGTAGDFDLAAAAASVNGMKPWGDSSNEDAWQMGQSIIAANRRGEADQRRKVRDRVAQTQGYAIAGSFASGGWQSAAITGAGFLGPGFGAAASIGIPLVGKLLGGIFGGGHKHRDIGTTPSNPLYTRDTLLTERISQVLNILLPQVGQQTRDGINATFREVRGQSNPTVFRTANAVVR